MISSLVNAWRNLFVYFYALFLLSCETTFEFKGQQQLLDISNLGDRYYFCTIEVCEKRSIKENDKQSRNTNPNLIVYFRQSSSKLDRHQMLQLQQKVDSLKNRKISLHGYTDNSGTQAFNNRLAYDRAVEVKSCLMRNGISESWMTVDSHPMCCYMNSNKNEEDRRQNRRVEIYIN